MADFNELKNMANHKSSWRDRLAAIEGLKEYDTIPAKDIIIRLAIHDPVFKVKEAAFRLAQSRGYQYKGQPVFLGRKPKGNLVKGINQKLEKVRNLLGEEFTLEEFKEAFMKKYPVEYDTYEGDKEDRFDKWLDNVMRSLPKKSKPS